MPFDGSLMPCDIVPVSVSLSSLQEVSSFSLLANCLWIFIYKYSMTLVCFEHWGLFKGHFGRECVHWDTTGFRVFTNTLVLPAFPSLNHHLYLFCLCIQLSSILHTIYWRKKKNHPKPVLLKWTTWSCSCWLRHLVFPPLNEFHPVEVGGAGCVEGVL